MLDFLSFIIYQQTTILTVLNSNLLTFVKEEQRPLKSTGEQIKIEYYSYLGFSFIFKRNPNGIYYELQIKGSIHYYFNLGVHNANTLTFEDFKNTMNEFLNKFYLNPLECFLRPCEYGFNIPYLEADALPFYCMAENRKLFKHHPKRPDAISGLKQNDFQFKIYSKSYQFPFINDKNTLRIEEKNNRSRGWQNLGIYTVNDLLIKDNHELIYARFKEHLRQLIIFDEHITINKKNRPKLSQFNNLNYWRKLIKKGSNNKEYNRRKKELEKLSKNQGKNILENLNYLIDLQYHINYNLTQSKPFELKKIRTYAQSKKSTYAQLCIECNSSTFYKWNSKYLFLQKAI